MDALLGSEELKPRAPPRWGDIEAALKIPPPMRSAVVAAEETFLSRAIVAILREDLGFADVEATGDLGATVEAARARRAPLVLIDSCLFRDRRAPETSFFDLAGDECPVVALADKRLVRYGPECWGRGALAVIDKRVDAAQFSSAIRAIGRGERPCRLFDDIGRPRWLDPLRLERKAPSLRERDRDVLRLIAAGFRNKQIAAELGLRAPTVKAYIARSFEVLEITNRTAAAICAHWLMDEGLL